jgi:hypothetical protein
MPIQNFKAVNDAYAAGNYKVSTWRKAPTQTTAVGIWFDLSMSPGNPIPNYYAAAPLEFTALKQSTDYGLPHGGNVETRVATSTGVIADYVFTDTTHGTGKFEVGMVLTGTGVTAGTTIMEFLTGTGSNNGGTYRVNYSQTVASTTITGTYTTGVVKYLHKLLITPMAVATLAPMAVMVLDYVGYYPFVDMADTVTMSGSTTLPRYTDGEGLQIMAVEVAAQIGGVASFYVTYTNQDGTAGRTSSTVFCNTQVVNGTIINSAAAPTATYPSGPFIPLQAGDTGVRSIETVVWPTGDVGLISLVLVKPLATIALEPISNSIFSPKEVDFAVQNAGKLPVIPDDAYLNLICLPTGTLSGGQLYGTIETIWS